MTILRALGIGCTLAVVFLLLSQESSFANSIGSVAKERSVQSSHVHAASTNAVLVVVSNTNSNLSVSDKPTAKPSKASGMGVLEILLFIFIGCVVLGYLLRSKLKWIISLIIGDIFYIGEKGSRYFTEDLASLAIYQKRKTYIKRVIPGTHAGVIVSSNMSDMLNIMDNPKLCDDKGQDIFCPIIPGLKDNKTFARFFIDLSEEGYKHRQESVVKYLQNPQRVEKYFYGCIEEFTKLFDSWVASKKQLSIFDEISDVFFRVAAREFFGWDNVDSAEMQRAIAKVQDVVNFGPPMTPFSKGIQLIKETNEIFREVFTKILVDNKESMLRTDNYSRFIAQQSADARGGKLEDHLTHDDMFGGGPIVCLGIMNNVNNVTRLLLAINTPGVCEDKQLVEKVRKEMEIVKDGKTSITLQAVNQSKMIDELYLEILRFSNSVRLVGRKITKPTMCGDVDVPADTFMILPIGPISDNKETWGEDVLKFRPSRFADKDIKGVNPQKTYFCPFSVGRRACPAFMVTKVSNLAFLVAFFGYKKYQLLLDPTPPFDNTDDPESLRRVSSEYKAKMVIDS